MHILIAIFQNNLPPFTIKILWCLNVSYFQSSNQISCFLFLISYESFLCSPISDKDCTMSEQINEGAESLLKVRIKSICRLPFSNIANMNLMISLWAPLISFNDHERSETGSLMMLHFPFNQTVYLRCCKARRNISREAETFRTEGFIKVDAYVELLSLGNVFHSNHFSSLNSWSLDVCDELGTEKFLATKAFSRVFKRF